jgi:hypothetical protein
MTSLPEMTRDEVMAHAVAIGAAQDEDQFVAAFAAYVRDVIERETEPYEKVALFVHGMLEGQYETLIGLARRGGGCA